jgi:hypothetical protein
MLISRLVCRCIDVIFFGPKGHSIMNKVLVFLNMESVYHVVTIRVNETLWAHVWRLRFCYLGTGYDKVPQEILGHVTPNFYFRILCDLEVT